MISSNLSIDRISRKQHMPYVNFFNFKGGNEKLKKKSPKSCKSCNSCRNAQRIIQALYIWKFGFRNAISIALDQFM
jgi:hypothetical protein